MLLFENVGYHLSREVTSEHPLLRAVMERGKILSVWHQGQAFLMVSCMKPRNCTVLNTFCNAFIALCLVLLCNEIAAEKTPRNMSLPEEKDMSPVQLILTWETQLVLRCLNPSLEAGPKDPG